MHSDTSFKSSICFTTFTLSETRDFLKEHKREEIFSFSGDLEVRFEESSKEFYVLIEGDTFFFTRDSFLDFCAIIGLAKNFAEKIPNDLLLENIFKLLDNSLVKIRFEIRDKNVVCGCFKENYARVDMDLFLESSEQVFINKNFREANIGDSMIGFLIEPQNPTITPITNDNFDVGVTLFAHLNKGLLFGLPYVVRHCCTNIATSLSFTAQRNPVEKISKTRLGSYDRFIDSCETKLLNNLKEEFSERIQKAANKQLGMMEYSGISKELKFLGPEVTMNLLGVDKFRHREIISEARVLSLKKDSTDIPVEDLDRWEIFNTITAASKGYLGEERMILQRVGGLLI